MRSRIENPFGDLIVQDPRRREPTVPDLNRHPLLRLLEAFERLVAGSTPREPISGDQAILITSADPGYGKSHLIGRLFYALHGRATLVYVQPFQNAVTPFQSLLLAVLRELHFPDRLSTGQPRDPEEPTQLDGLAHAVLAHLLADLAEGWSKTLAIDAQPETIRLLRSDPLNAFRRGADPWAAWLTQYWSTLERVMEEVLARRGVELMRPGAWLRVLRAYAFSPDDIALRRSCLDWLQGQPIDADEAERLGLRAGDSVGELTSGETNALCRTRLAELCQLSCFYRPFVFCFDQTEVYGHQPALARTFGMVIATLVHEMRGQLTLVTANQDPWTARIAPNLELADRQRIAEPPLTLEGLGRAQATELVRLRLAAAEIEPRRVDAFLRGAWMTELFPGDGSQLAPRVFLQKCKERWSKQPLRDFTLRELFEQRRERLLATPKRQLFEPDPLQWLVEVAAQGLPGISVETIDEPWFSVQWKTAERLCRFGFLSGNHWKQWEAVARASLASSGAKAVFFRASEQPPIPSPDWKVAEKIREAQRSALQIIVLDPEELALLYTGRDLYAQAAQGDIAYAPDEVLEFLHGHLRDWWDRLAGPLPAHAS